MVGALSNYSLIHTNLLPLPNVHKTPSDRSTRSHLRTDEMRPSALTLSALKVPIRRARTPLTRHQDIRIHTETHATTRLTPFKPRLTENLVQTFRLFTASFHLSHIICPTVKRQIYVNKDFHCV